MSILFAVRTIACILVVLVKVLWFGSVDTILVRDHLGCDNMVGE